MESSPLRSKAPHHGRSLSLPSTPNPLTSQVEESLSAVKSLQSTSSLLSFNGRIIGLKNVYCNLDDFILLPCTQQTISHESQQEWVDQVLDDHIKLLDSCSTTTDLLSTIKSNLQELLSALRRKDVNGINSYLATKTKTTKMIQKALKRLRNLRGKHSPSTEQDNVIPHMLKEAESATFNMIESLLSHTKGNKNQNSWSLVTKLMPSKKVSHSHQEHELNEFITMEALLQARQEDKLVNHLKEIDSSIQVVQEELECFYRQLIKTRVSLLNSLNF